MVVSEDPATARATQSSDVHTRSGAAWAGEADRVDPVAQTFKTDAQQRISLMELMNRISATGIGADDPRVREMVADPSDADGLDGGRLTMKQFSAVCEASGGLIARALRGDLVVPVLSLSPVSRASRHELGTPSQVAGYRPPSAEERWK